MKYLKLHLLTSGYRIILLQVLSSREFLTMDELMTIYQKEFALPRLALVRDVFIFAAFTGLAFIDIQQLATEHNGHYWIRKTRQYTNDTTLCQSA